MHGVEISEGDIVSYCGIEYNVIKLESEADYIALRHINLNSQYPDEIAWTRARFVEICRDPVEFLERIPV